MTPQNDPRLLAFVRETGTNATQCHPTKRPGAQGALTTLLDRVWTAACWASYQGSFPIAQEEIDRWQAVSEAWRTFYYDITVIDPEKYDGGEEQVRDYRDQLRQLRGFIAKAPTPGTLDSELDAVVLEWFDELLPPEPRPD